MSESEVIEEDVVYEEVPEPHVIETGDSVKVKQVLDDATMEAVKKYGYDINYRAENIKLFIMFISCVFALVAQFYPLTFPDSRMLLGICCAAYFILSTILQFIVTFIDKDSIIISQPHKDHKVALQIRASFPRFQEYYFLNIESFKPNDKSLKDITKGKLYVGKYFTSKGEFDEVGFHNDVFAHLERFEKKKYEEFEYNHKLD